MPPEPSSDSTKYIVGIVLIALVIIGVSWVNRAKRPVDKQDYSTLNETASQTDPIPLTPNEAGQNTGVTTGKSVITVVYTDTDGFTPDNLSIKVGDTVKFINNSSDRMWVASDIHPSHELYSGTTLREHCPDTVEMAFDQCGAGKEYSFTFNQIGNWKFHNHARARMGGVIVVK